MIRYLDGNEIIINATDLPPAYGTPVEVFGEAYIDNRGIYAHLLYGTAYKGYKWAYNGSSWTELYSMTANFWEHIGPNDSFRHLRKQHIVYESGSIYSNGVGSKIVCYDNDSNGQQFVFFTYRQENNQSSTLKWVFDGYQRHPSYEVDSRGLPRSAAGKILMNMTIQENLMYLTYFDPATCNVHRFSGYRNTDTWREESVYPFRSNGTGTVQSKYNLMSVYPGHSGLVGIYNTLPGSPGAFTQPIGDLETGDVKTISWGAGYDSENNIAKYVLEVAINGGSYSQVAQPTTTSYNYTIPTATSIKFRVKAVDSFGLESGYRESSSFVVTKPQYYWSKYNVAKNYLPIDNWSWVLEGHNWSEASNVYQSGYSNVLIHNNNFLGTGWTTSWNEYTSGGTSLYQITGEVIKKLVRDATSFNPYPSQPSYSVFKTTLAQVPFNNVSGTLIQSGIIAVADTYPNDGKHTDNFYYIRGSRVNQSIAPSGGFTNPINGTVLLPGATVNLAFNASSAINISLYEVDYKEGANAWTAMTYNNSLSRSYVVTTNKTLATVQFRVRAKNTSSVFSDYMYSDIYAIQHNVAPTINAVKLNTTAVINGGSILIPAKAAVALTFTPSDVDTGDTLQYRITVNNIEKVAYKSTPSGTAVNYTVAVADIMTGTNPVWIYVKDAAGMVASYQVMIRNKGPENYSLREVHGIITQFLTGG